MQAIVKEFLVPMSLCAICAVGGWSLGHDSSSKPLASPASTGAVGHLHAQAAAAADHHLDATRTLRADQPRLIRCDESHRVVTAKLSST